MIDQLDAARQFDRLRRSVVERLNAELKALDGYGGGEHGPHSGISNPVLATVTRRKPFTDDLQAINAYIERRRLMDPIILAVLAKHTERLVLPRCSGKIDPTCTNAAVEHRREDDNGCTLEVVTDLCDQCWLIGCIRCHKNSQEQYRGGLCSTCSRKQRQK